MTGLPTIMLLQIELEYGLKRKLIKEPQFLIIKWQMTIDTLMRKEEN